MINDMAAIDKIVHDTLIDVPNDHKMAFVTIANQDGVKAVFAAKIGKDWEIQTYGNYNFKDHNHEYGASLQWSK